MSAVRVGASRRLYLMRDQVLDVPGEFPLARGEGGGLLGHIVRQLDRPGSLEPREARS